MEKIILDNFEEYDDPVLYDQENALYKDDIHFLEKWASKTEGIIIDLACGTGRATIPLAEQGYRMIGVDLHNGMLNKAKKKAAYLELRIDWFEADCTKLDLNVKSKFVYSVGNSFQHFLTNKAQASFLTSVNKHLEVGGIFIFGTRFPNVEELLQPDTEEYWKTYMDRETGCKVDVYTISRYNSLKQVQHITTIRKFKNQKEKVVNEKRTSIKLRYTFPKEMERLLAAHGFKICHVYGDWKESSITDNSSQMIYVCKKITSC